MGRECDQRDFSQCRIAPERVEDLKARAGKVSRNLPGDHTLTIESLDVATGNPSKLKSTSAPTEKANYIERAVTYMHQAKEPLGLEESQSPEFFPSPTCRKTRNGAVSVYLQQFYRGIPIFLSTQTVRFAPDGALDSMVGSVVTVQKEQKVTITLSAEEATVKAAHHVAKPQEDELSRVDDSGQPIHCSTIDVSGFEPHVIATFSNIASRPTVLKAGPFEDEVIKASLTWFPLPQNGVRLAWEVLIALPNYEAQYLTLVDAQNGEILYCQDLVRSVRARGRVFRRNPDSAREMVDFPCPWNFHSVPIPEGLPDQPDPWIKEDTSAGKAVRVSLERGEVRLQGVLTDGVLTFDPVDENGDEQNMLNALYYACLLQNFSYLLEFGVEEDNLEGPTVKVLISRDVASDLAQVIPITNSGNPQITLKIAPQTKRHTALDAMIVFHEFTHTLTHRLIGGPLDRFPLIEPQSKALDEGLGDYIACTVCDSEVFGAWVTGDDIKGARSAPYDSQFPPRYHFGLLGKDSFTDSHTMGEIWCATLIEMNRQIEKQLALRLVFDAMIKSQANPSFLDMRDRIFGALKDELKDDQQAFDNAEAGIWRAFAKFGMGPEAKSTGAQILDIESDFETPWGEVIWIPEST